MAIDFPEDAQLAARYIKQAFPLMVKNGVTPNPCNITLWYTYVTNRDLELKNTLDKMIEKKEEFSEEVCRSLFRKHVMKDEVDLQNGLQESLATVLHELVSSVEKTKNGANDYQRSLEEGLEDISGDLTSSSLEDTIKVLTQATQSINVVTNRFQDQLEIAENEIMELRQRLHQEELRNYIDPLTQIGNRSAFDARMVELCQKEKGNVTLVLIDLDGFKNINDTYGHLMGDKILQGVGRILQRDCPENTLVARYGGEEFVCLLEDSLAAACQIAETIRNSISKLNLKKKSSGEIVGNITASFGIAQKIEDEFPDQLIERADNALYTAKQNGRNQVKTST